MRHLVWLLGVVWPLATEAQLDGFAGTWHGTAEGMTVNLVMDTANQYQEQEIVGAVITMQRGTYTVDGDKLVFKVEDWQPKSQQLFHPNPDGGPGGYYTQVPTPKPPGGVYFYRFLPDKSLRLQDANLHRVITLHRAS